ncbi:4-hydroxy-tetrahydrodipicolinate synthase [Lachnoclostridium phytofermentans]|uniref:4-hydroxy-tetrahydrodipicolinate synthase n=1 Tax=Lachnoclostridium phytofermentans TaxID=66219 RepID=UPI000494DB99|nr:4-hydroxy-tetrahydrodipicolinate synthase [Lachnoclostridium phytofermentans]
MFEIKGIIPPIVTPMNTDESINLNELRNQVNRLINAGVHGIFAIGTNGEGYALNEDEKEKVLETVVEETAKRVPVYAGVGCITTRDTIRLARKAEKMGCDVLSVITPSFAQASQEELYEHYKAIAEAVQLPIVLYNIPARTGNALATSTVERLAAIHNIVGVKDSSGNFDQMLQYIEATKDMNFTVLSGNDSLILWNLLAGGSGGIAGCANVYPENMVNIYEAFRKGDLEQARAAQDRIRSFRNCFRFGNPNTIVKTAVAMLGYPVGNCRSPFYHISEEGIEAIKCVLTANEKLGMK